MTVASCWPDGGRCVLKDVCGDSAGNATACEGVRLRGSSVQVCWRRMRTILCMPDCLLGVSIRRACAPCPPHASPPCQVCHAASSYVCPPPGNPLPDNHAPSPGNYTTSPGNYTTSPGNYTAPPGNYSTTLKPGEDGTMPIPTMRPENSTNPANYSSSPGPASPCSLATNAVECALNEQAICG